MRDSRIMQPLSDRHITNVAVSRYEEVWWCLVLLFIVIRYCSMSGSGYVTSLEAVSKLVMVLVRIMLYAG